MSDPNKLDDRLNGNSHTVKITFFCMVNEQGSNSKITAIFQTQPLTFNNGITVTVPIVPLNSYRSAWIAHA
jgi:hypothetical protein